MSRLQTHVICKICLTSNWSVWASWLVLIVLFGGSPSLKNCFNFDGLSRQLTIWAALPHELFQDWSFIWSIYIGLPVWPKYLHCLYSANNIPLRIFENLSDYEKICLHLPNRYVNASYDWPILEQLMGKCCPFVSCPDRPSKLKQFSMVKRLHTKRHKTNQI